jgi:hypothetical protein
MPDFSFDPYLDELRRLQAQATGANPLSFPQGVGPYRDEQPAGQPATSVMEPPAARPPERELRLRSPVTTNAQGMNVSPPLNLAADELKILLENIRAEKAAKGQGSIRYKEQGSEEWKDFQPTGPEHVTVTPEMSQRAQAQAGEQRQKAEQDRMLSLRQQEIDAARQHEITTIAEGKKMSEAERAKIALAEREAALREKVLADEAKDRESTRAREAADREEAKRASDYAMARELSRTYQERAAALAPHDPRAAAAMSQAAQEIEADALFKATGAKIPTYDLTGAFEDSARRGKLEKVRAERQHVEDAAKEPSVTMALDRLRRSTSFWSTTVSPTIQGLGNPSGFWDDTSAVERNSAEQIAALEAVQDAFTQLGVDGKSEHVTNYIKSKLGQGYPAGQTAAGESRSHLMGGLGASAMKSARDAAGKPSAPSSDFPL